jgi:uncharacterized membrane protein YcaP (DUF421 family)
MNNILFSDWASLGRTVLVGLLAYVFLVLFLRLSGKRTLSKLNAFDLVVTVALGSTLATVLLSKEVALAEGAVAFALLISMQFVVTWSSTRAGSVRRFVTGEPTLVFYEGSFLDANLRRARLTVEEVRASMRAAGVGGTGEVAAVVLETDGTLSVVRRGADAGGSTLEGLDEASLSAGMEVAAGADLRRASDER